MENVKNVKELVDLEMGEFCKTVENWNPSMIKGMIYQLTALRGEVGAVTKRIMENTEPIETIDELINFSFRFVQGYVVTKSIDDKIGFLTYLFNKKCALFVN